MAGNVREKCLRNFKRKKTNNTPPLKTCCLSSMHCSTILVTYSPFSPTHSSWLAENMDPYCLFDGGVCGSSFSRKVPRKINWINFLYLFPPTFLSPEETTRLNRKWLSQWKVHSVTTQCVPGITMKRDWNQIVASWWEKFYSCFVRLKMNCTTGLSLMPSLPQEVNAT